MAWHLDGLGGIWRLADTKNFMKPRLRLSIYYSLVVSITAAAALQPADASADQLTNQTFRTIFLGENLSGDHQDIQDLSLQKPVGKFGGEIIPAAEDHKGNWGQITNALQMSIRFYQNNYTNGQPVSAVILWRNIGGMRQPFDPGWGIEKYSFDVLIRYGGKDLKPLVPRIDPNYKPEFGGGPGLIFLEPNTQIRVEQRLDTIFDLSKPGAYEITAQRGGVRSGVATFYIYPRTEVQTNSATIK